MVEVVGSLVAGAPFVVAGMALLGLRWPAVWAGVSAFAAALAGAVLWPGLSSSGLPVAFAEGFGTSASVLYVLFGGLLLYNVLAAGGGIEGGARVLGGVGPGKEGPAPG